MDRTGVKAEGTWIKWCKALLLGGIVSFLTAMLLLALASGAISSGTLDGAQDGGVLAAAAAVAAVVGTLAASAVSGLRGLLLGVGVGLTLTLLQLTAGILLSGGISLNGWSAVMLCASVGGGAAVGTLGRGRKGRRRRAVGRKRMTASR